MFSHTTNQSSNHNIHQILSQETISDRIESLTKFFSQAALREQHSAFPAILANIFGYDQTKGWGLTRLTPTSDPVTYRVVSSFIEPSGLLFNLTAKLEQANLYYEFPLTCLPPPSQASICSPVKFTPDFYADKLAPRPPATLPSQLQLRAFDFFFFHFAYFLIYSQHIKHINPSPSSPCVWESISTCLYTSTLDSFLHHFLPLQQLKNSPNTSHNMFYSPPRHTSIRLSPTTTTETVKRRNSSSLLNIAMLTDSPYKEINVGIQAVREAGAGNKFLETLVEFWLGQVESSSPMDNFFGRGVQQHTHFMTDAHARFCRILCKHLHFWTARTPYGHSDTTSLSYAILRQPLFQLLRYCLAHWPQEPSFRMLLELWLTHIQPWRYEDAGKQAKSGHATSQQLDAKWFEFVSRNLPFYSTLFLEFLPRAFRLNLTHTRDAVLLSRVTRVFSQPGLPDMIRQAEKMVSRPALTSPRSRFLPERHDLQIHIVDLIGNMNAFTPMMTLQTVQAVDEIRASIDTMLVGLPEELAESNGNRGILSRFKDWVNKFVEIEEDYEDGMTNGERPNKDKLKQILQQSKHYFNCLFQTSTENSNQEESDLETSLNDSRLSPLQINSGLSQRVNSKGNLNDTIMNNSQNLLKIQYMGDPVLRAIQPHENKFLCRNLHKFSQYLNRKYAPQLMYVSQNEDLLISRIASIFLNERPPPSPFEQSTLEECEMPRLRFNLRPIASYYIIFLIFLVVNLPYLFGITFLNSLLILIFLLVIFISIPFAVSNKH